MIESPLIQEIVDESKRAGRMDAIAGFLEARFGGVTPTVTAGLQLVTAAENLARLTRAAALCANLQAFEDCLRQELPAPAPASTRGKRRPRKPSS